jgi:amidase
VRFAILFLSAVALVGCAGGEDPVSPGAVATAPKRFELMETTIGDVHAAFASGQLTSHVLVQMYLDRIEAYDKKGPAINAVISLNPDALAEADRLDAAYKSGGLSGPLHGIPILLKDQMDAAGMPTTLGTVLLKDYRPAKDAFVTDKLKKAGAIILGKVTLGELGGGDTYGSLFGATRNPYALERTAGGSSGGTGAAVSANFSTVGVGQEGFASIRRPSAWNSIVGMRPTAGLVSRSGVYAGWPSRNGSLGPMARSVEDVAKLLDVMVGYDAEDPVTAHGVGRAPESYTKFLDKDGLKGARIGIVRESLSDTAEPGSEDWANVDAVYAAAVEQLKAAGAVIVDNIVIPDVKALLARRASAGEDETWQQYFNRNIDQSPFKTRAEMYTPENIKKVGAHKKLGGRSGSREPAGERHYEYLLARDQLETNLLKVMADNQLDVIVHKTVEHTATPIEDGMKPPYPSSKGVPHINTFLMYASSMSVPAGFTKDKLPVGITFLGRPYAEPTLIKLAYAYEQSTHHRKPPPNTPPL